MARPQRPPDLHADAARAVLACVEDAPDRFGVSFWRAYPGGKGGHGPATDPPNESHTLDTLGAELTRLRSKVTPKRTGEALAGCTVREDPDDGWHLRRGDVVHVALAELDHDAQTLPLDAAAAALAGLGVGAVLHPSPSADARGMKWRAWVRVHMDVTARAAAVVKDALGCVRVALGAVLGCALDAGVSRPETLGFIGAANPDALGGVRVLPGGVLDALAVRERAIAAGWWTPLVDGRARTYDGAALYDLVAQVGARGRALGPGRWGLVCPRAREHSGGTGAGQDSSAVLDVNKALALCSHSHGGDGALKLRDLVRCWRGQGHDLEASLARVERPDLVRRVLEPWDDEPPADAPALDLAAVASVVEDAGREASRLWTCFQGHPAPRGHGPAGSPVVLLRLPLGAGKSREVPGVLLRLAPILPGELDARPDTPRPTGCIVVPTRDLADAAARGVDVLKVTRPGRASWQGARYLPVHGVRNGKRPVCPHWRAAEDLAKRGIDARGTLCGRAGTDDPLQLPTAQPGPCPRRDGCPAAEPWHTTQGGPVVQHDPWVACVTVQGAGAVPDPWPGAVLVLDETSAVLADALHLVAPAALPPGGDASRFLGLVRGRPGSGEKEACWTSRHAMARGVLAFLRALGVQALDAPDAPQVDAVQERRARVCAFLQGWSRKRAAEGAREAWEAAHPGAPDPVGAALDDWAASRPALRAARWMRDLPVAGVSWWHAAAGWLRGGTVAPELGPDHEPTGARVVRVPSPALALARRWRGPVLALDATGDPRALGARLGRPVVVRDVALPDAQPVRRVVCATSRATRTSLLSRAGVRWTEKDGARAAAVDVVRTGLRALEDHGARGEGGELLPVLLVAPPPLARALALAGGWTVEGTAAPLTAAKADPPPADLLAELVRVLPPGRGTHWTWAGGTLARGSNAPWEAGVRNTLTLGDPRVPPQEAAARAVGTGRDPEVQAARDAAAELAQAHGRARHVRARGPCTAVHVGALRPWDWRDVTVLDALAVARGDAPGVPQGANARLRGHPAYKNPLSMPPVPATGRAHAPTSGPVADALARGWTPGGLAACAGVDPRNVRHWLAGTALPSPAALDRLRAALADDVLELRERLRALLPRGRRLADMLRSAGTRHHGRRGVRLGLRDLAAERGRMFPPGALAELEGWLCPAPLGDTPPCAATLAALRVALPHAVSTGWTTAPGVHLEPLDVPTREVAELAAGNAGERTGTLGDARGRSGNVPPILAPVRRAAALQAGAPEEGPTLPGLAVPDDGAG